MYTTPRKVKQESRLRRSLSMTNTNRSASPDLIGDFELSPAQAQAQAQVQASETGPTAVAVFSSVPETTELIFCEETKPSSSSFLLHHHHLLNTPADESPLPASSNISTNNQALSASSSLNSALNHFEHHPPPYRDPPVAVGAYSNHNHNSSNSRLVGEPQPSPQQQQHQEKDWNSFQSKSGATGQELRSPVAAARHSRTSSNSSEVYQTHSSKFPIVKEVILSQTQAIGPVGLSGSAQNLSRALPAAAAGVSSSGSSVNGIINSKSQPQTAAAAPSYNKKLPSSSSLVNSASSLKSQLPFVGWTSDDNRKAFTLDGRSAKKVQDKRCSTVNSPSQRFTRRNSLDLEKFIQVFNEEQILMASMHGHGLQAATGSLGGIDNPALDLTGSHSNISSASAMYNGNGSKASSYYSSDSANSTSNSSQSQSLSSSNTDSLDTVIFKGQPSVGSIRDWQHQHQQQRASMESSVEHQHIPLDYNHSRSNSRTSENNVFRDTTSGTMAAAYDGQAYQIPPSQTSPYQPHYNNPNSYQMEYRSAQQHTQQLHHQHQHHQPQQHPPHTQLPLIQPSNLRNGHNAAYHQQQQQLQHQQQALLGSNPQLPTKSPLLSQKQFSSTDGLLDKGKEGNNKQFSAATAKTYNHIKDMISSRFGPSMNQHNNKNSGLSGGVMNNNVSSYNGGSAHAHSYNGSMDMTDIGLPSTSYGHGTHIQGAPQHHHQQQQLQQQANGHHPYHNHNSPPYYATPQPISPYNGHPAAAANGNQTTGSYLKSPSMSNDRKNVNTSFRKAIQKSTQKSNLVEDSLQMRTIHESPANLNANANANSMHQQQATIIAEQRAQRALDKLLCDGGNGLGPAPISQQQQFRSHPQHPQQGMSGFETSHKQPPPYPEKTVQHHPQHSILRNPGTNTFSIKPPIGSALTSNNTPHYSKPPAHRPVDEPPPLPTTKTPSVQDVRETGDGSAAEPKTTVEGQKLSPNSAKSEQLKQMTNDLQNLALSVVVGMNGNGEAQSSGSEGDMKGSQRVGSGQSHDSGVGTINSCKASPPPVLSSGGSEPLLLDGLIGERHKFSNLAGSNSSGNDSEWVDIVEPEIKQIIEMQRGSKPNTPATKTPSTNAHQQQDGGPSSSGIQTQKTTQSPKAPKKSDLTIHSKKSNHAAGPSSSHAPSAATNTGQPNNASGSGNNSNTWNATRPRLEKAPAKSSTMNRAAAKELTLTKSGKLTRSAMNQILYSLNDDTGDITSTTTGGLDESMLDGATENTSDDDDDLSTTIDTTDAHAIRRQLESLETMYTEVLKVLGGKKFGGAMGPRYPGTNDLRGLRRRPYGSMSSLPSSVSSRPFKETKRRFDEKRKVKDIKSINRRFQRLESHVVTLARSVAHLSSEMRTQHLMVQEMESIRNELSQLRTQIMKMPVHNPNQTPAQTNAAMAQQQGQKVTGRQGGHVVNATDWTSFRNALPSLTNPCRVRKLTKFFGDEPPLIRIFLKKLGYEKYAVHFEQERIGIMELPYLTEERLQKMGIPMGPRLRILQEAHMCLKPGAHFTVEHPLHNGNTGNLSVYVV